VLEAAAPHLHVTFILGDATELAALGTRLLCAQLPGLLCRGLFQRPCRQTLRCGYGHVFHLRQINIKSWPFLAESSADDDFSPTLGELFDVFQILGRQLP